MKQKALIVMLPTDGASKLHLYPWDEPSSLGLLKEQKTVEGDSIAIHLYVVTNEPIEADDWVLVDAHQLFRNTIGATGSVLGSDEFIKERCQKVIASTDPKVTALSHNKRVAFTFPTISDEDLQKYVDAKGEMMETNVEFEQYLTEGWTPSYNNPDNHNLDPSAEPAYRPKLDGNNCIIMTPIKESWTRDEVIALCKDAWIQGGKDNHNKTFDGPDKWISTNI